jgi:hypothetical protein
LLIRWAEPRIVLLLITTHADGTMSLHGPDRGCVAIETTKTGQLVSGGPVDGRAVSRLAHPAGAGAGPADPNIAPGGSAMRRIQNQLLAHIRWLERWRLQRSNRPGEHEVDRRAAAALADLAELVRRLPGDDPVLERFAALQTPLLDSLAPPPATSRLLASYGADGVATPPRTFLEELATAWFDEELVDDWADLDHRVD